MSPFLDNFDRKLCQGLQDSANSINTPDKEEAWAEITCDIQRLKVNKTGLPTTRKYAAVAVLILALVTALLTVADDYAMADFNLFQTVKSVFCNVVNISGATQTDNEPAVMNIDENSRERKLYTLEQAQQIVIYDISVPSYVPPFYTLDGVFIQEDSNTLSSVELHYVNSMSETDFIIDEKPTSQATSFSYNFRSNNAETSNILLDDYEATLIYFKETGIRKLLWQGLDRYYTISATAGLDEDEIIKVAKSLKK